MAMALPTVASNVGGISGVLIDGETGLLLQSNSAEVSAHASAMHDRLPRELSSKTFHMPSTAR